MLIWADDTAMLADPLRAEMRASWLAEDAGALAALLPQAGLSKTQREFARGIARDLVERLRRAQQGSGGVDALLAEFSLSTEEGVALMCLAEALLRVPDSATADALIRDKLQGGDWSAHLGQSDSVFVNASAWALLFTGKLVNFSDAAQARLHGALSRAAGRLGQPVIRRAVRQAMATMGQVFVMGRDIGAAMDRATAQEARGYRYSYDMLGEGARTASAAADYLGAYHEAIRAIGARHADRGPEDGAGISVKLSALHPRFEYSQRERVLAELSPRLRELALAAREADIGLAVDAEEAARLDLSLEVIAAVFADPALRGWSGFGVAVQAYQKRAPQVIEWLAELAGRVGRRLQVRLVKGAYWDAEIKHAQVQGLSGFPVFTRKPATDVCYQACARQLLALRERLFPQFATHNAWAVAAILAMDEGRDGYEFQRLHGMGEALYDQVMREHQRPCRIYAPVGEHEDLLAYLVRRLLENGANSSFVNNIVDPHVVVDSLIEDPVEVVRGWSDCRHPAITLPVDLFGAARRNSAGLDLSDTKGLQALRRGLEAAQLGRSERQAGVAVRNPACREEIVGTVSFDDPAQLEAVVAAGARAAGQPWPVAERSAFLLRLADAIEAGRDELVWLCIKEAGKTVGDALAELREAVDFCRYYAARAQELPAGEGLGLVLCISPWNFPLAIFLGQVAGALAAGNAVLAKPAEQTSLIALRALALMQACGLPRERVQCVLGPGPALGARLVPDPAIRGVLFTGSVATGRWLFETLAARPDGPVPLIAETGGQNAMIVDSTALPEQVVDDVIRSAFHSAGQRCSALRVLFVQDEIADRLLAMIAEAMDELVIGDPALLKTDVGPVIDARARARLDAHVRSLAGQSGARLLKACELTPGHAVGEYFAPRLYELDKLARLGAEVFGPVLHAIRYEARDRDQLLQQIEGTGFGLTLGVHSRIQRRASEIAHAAPVGNVYVNRDMIGAVVGVQPFGGRGLSGTGPKAGGPLYLTRLMRRDPVAPAMAVSGEAQTLAGPTGECNLYWLEPHRQVRAVYAAADSAAHAAATIAAVDRAGGELTIHAPADWAPELRAAHGAVIWSDPEPDAATLAGLSCLALAPGSRGARTVLKRLAAQAGPIPVIVCEEPSPDYWLRFVREKVVTTDTTAAGGNASLMTLTP